MNKVTAYSTIYGNLTQENQDIYCLSLESYLAKNPDHNFMVFLIDFKVPNWIKFIRSKYGPRLIIQSITLDDKEKELWSKYKTFRFCYRFLKKVTDMVPTTRVASLDLDLFHENPIRGGEIDWNRINMSADGMYSSDPRKRNEEFHAWSGFNLPNYLNAGVVIFDKEKSSKVMESLSNFLSMIFDGRWEEPKYHDQDILNYLFCDFTDDFNVLSEKWNFSFRGVGLDIYKTQYFHMTRFEGVISYHIFSGLGDCRIDLMAYLANRHGLLQGSYLRTDKVTDDNLDEVSVEDVPSLPVESLKGQEVYNKENLSNLTVMVISRDQESTIGMMDKAIKNCLPGVDIMYVLDRCSSDDKSDEILDGLGSRYVKKDTGFGFDAPGARNFGVEILKGRDILFLDGDRCPRNLTGKLAKKALDLYDMTVLPVEFGDCRPWFTDDFMANPWYKRWTGVRDDNGVYTCGLMMRSSAVDRIKESQEGSLFHPSFTGRYGEEDLHLGYLAYEVGVTCGAFPKYCYVDGNFSSARDILDIKIGEAKCKILCDTLLKSKGLSAKPNDHTSRVHDKRKHFKNKIQSRTALDVDRSEYPIYVFYHVAQIGNWKDIYDEQISRLKYSGLAEEADKIFLSVVGEEELDISSLGDKFQVLYKSDNLKEYEIPTLNAIKDLSEKEDFRCLYFHTKGASSETLYNKKAIRSWRRFLEHFTIDRYEECAMLVEVKSAVGPSLLKKDEGKLNGIKWPENKCFGGNFWWSNSDYIKTLPMLSPSSEWTGDTTFARASAETWIGKGNSSEFMELKQWTWGDPYYFEADEEKYRDRY